MEVNPEPLERKLTTVDPIEPGQTADEAPERDPRLRVDCDELRGDALTETQIPFGAALPDKRRAQLPASVFVGTE